MILVEMMKFQLSLQNSEPACSPIVSVSTGAKFRRSTTDGWLRCDDVEMFADTDPAGSTTPSSS